MTTRPTHATRRWRAVFGTVAFLLVLVACGRLTEAGSGPEDNAIGKGGGDTGQSVPGSTGDPGAPPDTGDGTGTICIETTPGGDNPEDPVVGCADGDDDPSPPTSTPVTPRPGMADLYPIGWDRVDVADDDRTLTIHFWSGIEPCYVLDHVDVAYGTDTITITLHEGHDPHGEDVACIEIAMAKSVTIQLDEPLAGRALVDGAEPGGEE